MDLGRQWNERIRIWTDYLPRLFYTELGTVSAAYFTTMEHLTLEEAQQRSVTQITGQQSWGKKWEYAWFHFSITVSDAASNRRIVCYPELGGESLVFVNGKAVGAIDKRHTYIPLTKNAHDGDLFDLYAECYAGHGIRPENGGPYGPDEIPVPEPKEPLTCYKGVSWGIWNEAVYQTAMDVSILYQLLSILPETSLRAQKVAEALKQFTLEADYELPETERTEGIVAAGKKLKPLLDCVNGSTAPVMSIFGQSHLDLAWLWPFEETKRKCARTYANQLTLMEEYPDYLFLACEPFILTVIQKHYPELYDRIKKKIKSSRLICDGAFWIECDTNIPCGEAIIRQLVWGTQWYEKNCNTTPQTAWLPDSFGFSAALPQILKGCGVTYFTTQKLTRIDPECDQFPYNTFYWQGLDGTRILSHIYKENNADINPVSLWTRWNEDRRQKDTIDGMLFPFGFGDGGGGATRDMLEAVCRMKDLEGIPRTRMETPAAFFSRYTPSNDEKPLVKNVYTGELYLSWHRGTYTSQARTKRLSRRTETALREADLWTALAIFAGRISSRETALRMKKLWGTLLFCQFHDILSGTSIKRVHEEAESELSRTCEQSLKVADQAVAALAESGPDSPGRFWLVTNSLGWNRTELITHPETGAIIKVHVPAFGWTIVPEKAVSPDAVQPAGVCTVRCEADSAVTLLENDIFRIRLDRFGQLTSIYDKEQNREFAAAPCNRFSMYKDVTPFYDAWELAPMYKEMPLNLDQKASISILAHTPDCIRIKIIRPLHDSRLEQILVLRSGSRRIDFETVIDWKEKHKLLKVDFPFAIHAEEAFTETQFGYVKRPTHTSRLYDRDRYEICNHRYTAISDTVHGAAILNDCKYGVSVQNDTVSLSLLRSAVIPDMTADRGIQRMTYSAYLFRGPFEQSDTIREAYNLNTPLRLVQCSSGKKAEWRETSFFSIGNPAIILETVKPFDNGDGIVLRLYESTGGAAKTQIATSVPCTYFYGCDMREQHMTEPVPIINGKFIVQFNPFEIKTIILTGRER